METWKEFDQNVITHSAAHHLMAIDDLIQKLGYARVSDVARQLSITRGSVSISLQPLKKIGLVLQDENRHLRLSETGQGLVDAIKTKRRVIQRFFHGILGIGSEKAEIDACKMEHLVSNETAQRLIAFLRFVESDEPTCGAFLRAWSASDAACNHEPTRCPSCETECLSKKVEE